MSPIIIGRPFTLGGGGLWKDTDAVIRVKAPSGATIIGTKNGVTLDFSIMYYLDSSSVIYYAIVPSKSFDSNTPWTISITNSGSTRTRTVYVDAACEYNIAINWNVPEGYTEVEYIECTAFPEYGGQNNWRCVSPVIPTPFKKASSSTVDSTSFINAYLAIKCKLSSSTHPQYLFYMSNNQRLYVYRKNGQAKIAHYSNASTNEWNFSSNTNPTEYKFVGASYTVNSTCSIRVYLNGSLTNTITGIPSSVQGWEADNSIDIWYGEIYTDTTGKFFTNSVVGSRLYYVRSIRSDGSVAANCIACRRDSDGKLGFYQTANDTFYLCHSEITFAAGPDVL